MSIQGFDHVAIPIENVDDVLTFYRSIGFVIDDSLAPRLYSALLAEQKINFHGPTLWRDTRFTLKGPTAQPGCGDFCFVWTEALTTLQALLAKLNIQIIEGPVARSGGRAEGTSVYVRDPDGNLIEFICYSDP